LDHFKKPGVRIWFTLKIEIKVQQCMRELINQFLKHYEIHITPVSFEQVHPTGTLRTMEVAIIGGFNGKVCRVSPMNYLTQ
jgi:hypothetical protein